MYSHSVDRSPYCKPACSDVEVTELHSIFRRNFSALFIHSFSPTISIAPLQVLYHSEALPTTGPILYRRFTPKRTGNCRQRTWPRALRDGQSGSRTHDPPVESNRLNQCAITSHNNPQYLRY